MEKTIEERAKEYGEFTDKNGGRTCEWSYYKGATDQQKIDIEKACEWLKNKMHLDQQAFCDDNYIPTENCLEAFRKAMEEKQI